MPDRASGQRTVMTQAAHAHVRSLWPSGVTIIATLDDEGCPRGFTASSFCWLSLRPPLVSFFLACDADSCPAFTSAEGFSVNVLQPHHEQLAIRFATKGADKFSGSEFSYDDDSYPELTDAFTALQCRVSKRLQCDAHVVVVGEVTDCRVTAHAVPMIQYGNAFRPLPAYGDGYASPITATSCQVVLPTQPMG